MTHRQRRRILVASCTAATVLMVAVMVPDAGAEDVKDSRSGRGAGHFRFAAKTVARQQPQDVGFVQ